MYYPPGRSGLLPALLLALIVGTCLTAHAAAQSSINPHPQPLPGMMLASPWPPLPPPVQDLLVSEKLDGVRARWDGARLWTRGGQPITAPIDFTHGWPEQPMDGELWRGPGQFDSTSALVRRGNPDDPGWRSIRLWAFDLPAHPGSFEQRHAALTALLETYAGPHLTLVPQERVPDTAALQARLQSVLDSGGEGLIAHHRHNRYQSGRSPLLFKLKPWADAEAQVIAHLPGKGKHSGQLGALLVRDAQGHVFRLGTGLTDAQRRDPPPPGSTVTYRFTERTAKGLPRFPRFLRLRDEEPAPTAVP